MRPYLILFIISEKATRTDIGLRYSAFKLILYFVIEVALVIGYAVFLLVLDILRQFQLCAYHHEMLLKLPPSSSGVLFYSVFDISMIFSVF